MMSWHKSWEYLEIGENYLHNDKFNQSETVILESLENSRGERVFRIIHATPILDKNRPSAEIQIYTKLENKTEKFSDLVYFYLTSRDNSPGFTYFKWKDGLPLQLTINKNNYIKCNIQPRMTKYLTKSGKCQKESYYECIASHLDVIEINECHKKCIPNVFSNLGKAYNTPFCLNDTASQKCILKQIKEHDIGSNCKKSCSNTEYFGEVELNLKMKYEHGNWYKFKYKLINQDFQSKVYEEYLIYDAIGMIGQVGGTLGTLYFFAIVLLEPQKINSFLSF